MSRTRNGLAAGAIAGTAQAVLSPGNLGVVCGTFACSIPVVGQVLAVGTLAACAVAALTDDEPVDSDGFTARQRKSIADAKRHHAEYLARKDALSVFQSTTYERFDFSGSQYSAILSEYQ